MSAELGPPALPALLAVELRRAFARRVVRIMALVVVASCVIASLIVAIKSQPPTAEDRALEQRIEDCIAGRNDPPNNPFGEAPPGFEPPPVPDDIPREFVCRGGWEREFAGARRNTFELRELTGIVRGTSVPLVLVALIFGATLIAAEWRTGVLATQLAWESRRVRLMLAKLFAAIVTAIVFYVVMQLILCGLLALAAATRGSMAGVDLGAVAGAGWRFVVLVALATAFGFGVGSIGKNSAAALGFLAGYLMIAEQMLAILPWLRPWLMSLNGAAFIVGGIDAQEFASRTALEGFLTLLLYAGGAVSAAVASFRARDVLS